MFNFDSHVRWMLGCAEELADSLSEEDNNYLACTYKDIPLQEILVKSSEQDMFDFICCSPKKRETLKKFGTRENRLRLTFQSILHLQVVINSLRDVEELAAVSASLLKLHIQHPPLKSPDVFLEELYKDPLERLRRMISD